MSSANLYFPGLALAPSKWTEHTQAIAAVSVTVSITCAALMFFVLYSSDARYPIAATRYAPAATALPEVHRARVTSNVLRPLDGQETVARNHIELLALEQLGTRNYVEFSLRRSDVFEPVGPVEIAVRRIEGRHGFVQMSVLVGQHRVDKRLRLNQPVLLSTAYAHGLQIVVNSVKGSQITGYVSEPKYHQPQLAPVTDTTVVAVP